MNKEVKVDDPVRVIVTGAVSLRLLAKLALAFGQEFPKALALDGGHAVSLRHGATIVLVRKDDPCIGNTDGHGPAQTGTDAERKPLCPHEEVYYGKGGREAYHDRKGSGGAA